MDFPKTSLLKQFACKEYYSDWAKYLNHFLSGSYLERAQSFDKDSLYLQFAKKNFRACLEIKFCDGYLMIFKSLKDLSSTKIQRGQLQFKELENSQVARILPIENDRQICFEFNTAHRLWIKGFGKFSNVLLQEYHGESNQWHPTPSQLFRLGNKSDWEFQFCEIPKNPTEISPVEEISEDLINHWQESSYQEFRNYIFTVQKQGKLKKIEQRLQHLRKIRKESSARLLLIQEKRSNKEIGDLILAHAHSLKPGISKALITDYYTQQRIWIKLNPDLNPQENAKKYYGKAKNEIIEFQKLTETIKTTDININELELEKEKLSKINSLRDLKDVKSPTKEKKSDTLPYKEYQLQGYIVWVGKNNKSNDELLRLSSKNDLWMHAKDVVGSHVIIRKRGIAFSKEVLLEAGALAAANSKAKTQTVVPVIYTLRKFVSKIKGGLPGQVTVMKENILDIYLK